MVFGGIVYGEEEEGEKKEEHELDPKVSNSEYIMRGGQYLFHMLPDAIKDLKQTTKRFEVV
ncbi:hypothetical protein M8C21_001111 [Ambrosia artemisiifolia]|uniref:Uncharacterized protein n=1 Tax=Ambrosia artemisiifolia TaxID=4212 RepID=A0AAD5G5V9_AMBAR|nr:hypothetical protein M8C21_001111 [Ambrosia artemisiifolia]